MKMKTLISAGAGLFVLGIGPAMAGPCTAEIDTLAKTIAAKKMPAPVRPQVHRPPHSHRPVGRNSSSILRAPLWARKLKARRRRPRMCAAKPRDSRPQRRKEQRVRRPVPVPAWKRAAHSTVHASSIGRARKPSAWRPFARPSNSRRRAKLRWPDGISASSKLGVLPPPLWGRGVARVAGVVTERAFSVQERAIARHVSLRGRGGLSPKPVAPAASARVMH